jgi:hypothetical protein
MMLKGWDGIPPRQTSSVDHLSPWRPLLEWVSIRSALQNEQVRESIEEIRPPGLAPRVSTLRLLDAATWIRYSKSRYARKARKAAGLG